MQNNFDHVIGLVLQEEGGFVNNPKDPGGMTNLGVTLRVWEAFVGHSVGEAEMRALTPAIVTPLYKQNYWDKVSGDNLPRGLDYAVMDFAVNSGPVRAAKTLQEICGVNQDGSIGPATLAVVNSADPAGLIDKLCNQRLAFLKSLSTFATFGKGWTARVTRVKAASEQMAQGAGSAAAQA